MTRVEQEAAIGSARTRLATRRIGVWVQLLYRFQRELFVEGSNWYPRHCDEKNNGPGRPVETFTSTAIYTSSVAKVESATKRLRAEKTTKKKEKRIGWTNPNYI